MCLKVGNFRAGIIVKDADAEIVRPTQDPVLGANKLAASNWQLTSIKGLQQLAVIIIVNVQTAGIKAR